MNPLSDGVPFYFLYFRAQLLSEAVTQVFLTVSLYRLYLLLIDIGRRKITKAPSLMLKVGPCCCWPCLPFPDLDMIDSRLTWIRLIILQLPIIQVRHIRMYIYIHVCIRIFIYFFNQFYLGNVFLFS